MGRVVKCTRVVGANTYVTSYSASNNPGDNDPNSQPGTDSGTDDSGQGTPGTTDNSNDQANQQPNSLPNGSGTLPDTGAPSNPFGPPPPAPSPGNILIYAGGAVGLTGNLPAGGLLALVGTFWNDVGVTWDNLGKTTDNLPLGFP